MDAASPAAARWGNRIAPLLLVAAGVAVYANSLAGDFVLDDRPHIVENTAIRDLSSIPELVQGNRRAVVTVSFALNYQLNQLVLGDGLHPAGYHAVNVLIHLLAGLALLGIARRALAKTSLTDATWRDGVAFAIALLWLVHPLNTQAVTYVIQRHESLMGLLYLLALYGLIRSAEARGREGQLGWGVVAVAAGGLGMLTKEVMVTLPVVALLYDRAFLSRSFAVALRRHGPVHGLLALGALALAVSALGPSLGLGGASGAGEASMAEASAGFGSEVIPPAAVYAMNQPTVILHYLRLAVWPVGLTFDYLWPVRESLAPLLPAMVMVGLLGVVALVAVWRWPKVGFLGAAFFVVLAPTSSVLPIADLAAEHRMYLPLAAVVALGVVAVAALLRRRVRWHAKPVGAVLLVVVAAALGTGTVVRNHAYGDAVRLWRDTIAKAPHNHRAHLTLGSVLFQRGQVDEAIASYERALALAPAHARARLNLGVALAKAGRLKAAIAQLREAVRLRPDHAPAHHQLGVALAKAGQFEMAVRELRRAVRQDPELAVAWEDLGNAYYQAGQLAEAERAYRESAARGAADADLLNMLGLTLARQDRVADAALQWAAALEMDPAHADARANLARARAMLAERAAAPATTQPAPAPAHAPQATSPQ